MTPEVSRRWLVGLALYLGAVGVAAQVLMIRALMSVMGGSQWAIALTLGSWMVWIGLGSGIYHVVARGIANQRRLAMALLWSLAALIPLSYIAVLALPRMLTGMPGLLPAPGSMGISAFFLLAPLCVVQGLLFVQGSALLASTGRVYLWESAGSVIAGLTVTALALVTGDPGIAAAIAGLSALMAALLLSPPWRAAGYGGIALCATLSFFAPDMGQGLQWRGMETTASIPCRSGTATVVKQGGETSVFLNGGLYAWGGEPVAAEQQLAVLLGSSHTTVSRLLISGGGQGNLLRAMESLGPVLPKHILLYETDASLPAAERKALPFIETHNMRRRIETRHSDLRLVLSKPLEPGTMVWIRQGDPVTLAGNRWYTEEFFRQATGNMRNPGCAIAFSAGEATDYLGDSQARYLARLGHTALGAAGPGWTLDIIPLDAYLFVLRYSGQDRESPGIASIRPRDLWDRLAPVHQTLRRVSLPWLQERLSQSRIEPLARKIMGFKGRTNRDDTPVSAAEALQEVHRRLDPDLSPWPASLADPPPLKKPLLIALLCIAAVLFAIRRRMPRSFGPLLAVGCMAAAGMGAEVIVLFGFETVHGSVYVAVAWMLAVYMAGMTGGTALAVRWPKTYSLFRSMAALCLILVFAAVMEGWAPAALASYFGTALLLALVGAASGAVFAAAAHNLSIHFNEARTARWLNGIDHLGAAVAAFGVGLLLVPVLGATVSLWGCALLTLCGLGVTFRR